MSNNNGKINYMGFFIVINLILLSYTAFWNEVSSYTNIQINLGQSIIFFLTIAIIVYSLNHNQKNTLFNKVSIFILLICLIISLVISTNKNTVSNLNNYYLVFLLFICILLNVNVNIKIFNKLIILTSIPLTILGIIQSLSKTPVVNITYNGHPLVNSIYYFDGMSSSTSFHAGEIVRAFGITDSGLTLGIILLCGLFVTIYSDFNNYYKIALSLLFFCGILLTNTRNIYISLILGIIIIIVNRKKWHKKLLKIFYIVSLVFSSLFPFLTGAITYFTSIFNTYNAQSFAIRYQLIDMALFNLKNFNDYLFGVGLDSKMFWYSVDNGAAYSIITNGLVSFVIIQLIILYIVFVAIDAGDYYNLKGIIIICLLYPFISSANVVDQTYYCLFIILVFGLNYIANQRREI